MIQAHQIEKAELLKEIGKKERLMVEEHSEKIGVEQQRIADLVAQVNSKNKELEEVRKVESSLRDELEKKHDAELRSLRADYTNESDNLKAQIDVLRTAKLSSESALQVAITNQTKAFDEKFATYLMRR